MEIIKEDKIIAYIGMTKVWVLQIVLEAPSYIINK